MFLQIQSLVVSRRQLLLLLLLLTLTCSEAFARPSTVNRRTGGAHHQQLATSSRRSVLQAPRTTSSSVGHDEEERRDDSKGSSDTLRQDVEQQQQTQRRGAAGTKQQAQQQQTSAVESDQLLSQSINRSDYDSDGLLAVPTRVEFVAETKLPTDLGAFQLRAYRLASSSSRTTNPQGEPCVIYSRAHPPFGNDRVPVRIHDQCLTSEVFRSQRYVPSVVADYFVSTKVGDVFTTAVSPH
jgi:hypothetical protein